MDEAESNPSNEKPNLNLNESEKNTEVKDTGQSTKKESTENTSESIAQPAEAAGEIKERNTMEDDEGEDLPDNFFDDFSNNDFMDGLNIVDDWMDEEEETEKRRGGDDYFQDDEELRPGSSERKQDPNEDSRRESSPRNRSRYGDRDLFVRRDRYSREDERYRRQRDRSLDRRSRNRDLDRRRSRERDFERRRSRSRDRFRDERRSRDRFRSRDRERSKPKESEKRLSDLRNSKNDSKDVPLDENIDSRRDPEKTKRDIQRDKLRCAKDFEARVFQEQLKVAETGLVPPGTELDVVMEHEKRKLEEQQTVTETPPERKKEELEPPPRPAEKKRSVERPRGSDKSHSTNQVRQSRERHSRDRHSRDRRSRERFSRERDLRDRRSRDRDVRDRRSRDRDARERRGSPDTRSRTKREYDRLNRSRDRSHSPRFQRRSRSLDREEMYRRNDDLRLRIREKRRERYLNELSPVSEVRFSRSPSLTNLSLISNISEREFWLRSRDKYKSRYGRSCSPISSSSLSDLGSPKRKRSRKASFMEEIERKLREKAKRRTTDFGMNPDPPKPVPPPHQFPQQMPVNMAYQPQNPHLYSQNPYPQPPVVDHGMMMHQHHPMPLMSLMTAPPAMGAAGMMGPSPPMVEPPMMQMAPVVNQMPMQVQQQQQQEPLKLDSSLHRTASNLKPCVSDANKEVTKLFEEQKISLSDYLSVSAKPIDPKLPVFNVHRKIKVISKCQDVIRVLKDDSKFCGRFFPRPAPPGFEKPEEKSVKWKSPLRKTFPVRFMFTTPSKKSSVQQDFVKNIINKLLFVCGIPILPGSELPTIRSAGPKNNASTTSKPIPSISTSQAYSTQKTIPPPISFSVVQQKPKNTPLPQQSVLIQRTSIGLQTDPVKCQICEIRSARKYSDHGCQTNEKEMVDESTQVTNEDLQKSMVTFTPRGILKNSASSLQSLSHLTPAQLLALQQEKTDDGWNIASRNDSYSRNPQDQFSNSPGNFMGRTSSNLSSLSSSYGSNHVSLMNNPTMSTMGSRLSTGSSFTSSFGGSMDKLPFSSLQNRSFSGQLGSQPSMNPGNSLMDFQNMASRNAVNRPSNFDRFSNDRISSEQSFNDPNKMNFNRNMAGNVSNTMNSNTNVNNRGRGAPNQGQSGFFMGNYSGQNRPFYN